MNFSRRFFLNSVFSCAFLLVFCLILVSQSHQYSKSDRSRKAYQSHSGTLQHETENFDDEEIASLSSSSRRSPSKNYDNKKSHHPTNVKQSEIYLTNPRKTKAYPDFNYELTLQRGYVNEDGEDDVSIEEADDERIDEIVAENDKNLLIFFYERESRCPKCKETLQKLEQIDDDLETTGYIEVVKSRDKSSAQQLGVYKFPTVIYFRRKNPIFYDGDFEETSQDFMRWVRSHDEVVTVELDDSTFEEKTDSYSPSRSALDWFILFYDSKKTDCNSYVAMWEAVAYRLRGLVNVGRVDVNESDDVAHRFSVDDEDDCPTFILFRRGKMYRFRDVSRDEQIFTAFALHKYKEQRGRRVPEPPTMIQEVYETVKEFFAHKLGQYGKLFLSVLTMGLMVLAAVGAFWYMKQLKRGKADSAATLQSDEKAKDS